MGRTQITVETAQLDSTAASIETLADTYKTQYTNLFGIVEELKNAWSGVDNVAYTNQIEGFHDDFQKMEQLMRSYAEFLKKSAAAYRETQQSISGQTKNLAQGS